MTDNFKNDLAQALADRRIAPRHKVNLRASVLITAVVHHSGNRDDDEQYIVFQGQLLDVSWSGLAIIISTEDYREIESLGENAIVLLQLLLPLPARAIELEAAPARFAEIVQGGKKRVLLGAHITKMSERDRVLFMDFIKLQENAN